MTHACPAHGCNKRVPDNKLMCFDHWSMVPRAIQTGIYANYRPGQTAASMSPEYKRFFNEALTYLRERIQKVQSSAHLGRNSLDDL